MQLITETVRKTYINRFDELELDYRFHFASRLYAWTGDVVAAQKLRELQPIMVPSTHTKRIAALRAIREELKNKDYERDVNDYARRKPYFEAYPDLLFLHNVLFKLRHWYCVYDIDERTALYELIPRETIEHMLHSLLKDTEALRRLSTYAVNTFYLYEKLFGGENLGARIVLDPAVIDEVSEGYDLTKLSDVQIFIYFYTHCIIGESLFYYQPPSRNLAAYTNMLQAIEELLQTHYDNINLDNKFEFLVCAKLCGFTSKHESRIYEEARHSLHTDGYIVDTLNHNRNPAKQTFLMSEHRNVLFLMSHMSPLYRHELSA